MKKPLFAAMAAALALAGSAARADAPMPLDRPTSLVMQRGDTLRIHGAVRTSLDGTTFDAASATSSTSRAPGSGEAGGLFELDGSGLRVASASPAAHEYVLVATGDAAPTCARLHVAAPCLAPRTAELAHQRLVTQAELLRSFSGSVSAEVVPLPPPPAPPILGPRALETLGAIGAAMSALGLAAMAWSAARARRRTPLGQVLEAARVARASLAAERSDPTTRPLLGKVDDLVQRARDLEAAGRAAKAKLARIDAAALEKKRASLAAAADADPDAAKALAWLTEEAKEAERLKAEVAACGARLERIGAALRVLGLRARADAPQRLRVRSDDPVDALALELEARDAAFAEVDAMGQGAAAPARSRA